MAKWIKVTKKKKTLGAESYICMYKCIKVKFQISRERLVHLTGKVAIIHLTKKLDA
jgi:hypothetical protein